MEPYKLQKTSVWSFPNRGCWATHRGDYRGNWSPHIPKNLLLRYTNPKDTILDCFVGSGTTLIEAKILNRNAIGIDINQKAVDISRERLNFQVKNEANFELIRGDAQDLNMILDNSIDFICTHPPYADIIQYSEFIETDLSKCTYTDFLSRMEVVSKELHRTLKKGKFCSFMIGDIRKNGNVIPLGFLTMQAFLKSGFSLNEIIIKEQHNCKRTHYWQNKCKSLNIYLLAHEYIFIMSKNE